jgi:hypothetical protein
MIFYSLCETGISSRIEIVYDRKATCQLDTVEEKVLPLILSTESLHAPNYACQSSSCNTKNSEMQDMRFLRR